MRLCLTFARLSSTAELAHIRFLLFAPGSDEGKLRKALESGADAVVADLDDAVTPAEKERAREVVALLLRGTVPRTKKRRRIHEVIAAFEGQEKGVLALNGSMIDLPVVERARRVLAEAKGATE